jgi:hypothetical protein
MAFGTVGSRLITPTTSTSKKGKKLPKRHKAGPVASIKGRVTANAAKMKPKRTTRRMR